MIESFEELFVARPRRRRSAGESFYRDLLGLTAREPDETWAEEQPNPPTPSGLILVDHSQLASRCVDGRSWFPAADFSTMSPSTMDPGFLTSAGKLQFDGTLDKGLIDLLVDDKEFKTFLDPESVKKRSPSAKDKIRVCLVDLSGAKICRPGYAGWGSTTEMGGSSTAKIALVYAAHQIVFDLKQMADARKITSVSGLQAFADGGPWKGLPCKPKVDQLVAVGSSGVEMAPGLKTALDQVVFGSEGNRNANNILLNIGFGYLASLMWQSGLRHPDAKGLWFSNSYQGAVDVKLEAACHLRGDRIVCWAQDPFKSPPPKVCVGGGITLTARSVATFYTLLAQRRLVTPLRSDRIETLLKKGCTVDGVLAKTLPGAVRAAKCGIASGFVHDSALIQHDKVRYVMVYLTKDLGMPEGLRTRFIKALDALIVRNNP